MHGQGHTQNFQRGFPSVVDPRCSCLGPQPPAADEQLIFKIWQIFDMMILAEHYTYVLVSSTAGGISTHI